MSSSISEAKQLLYKIQSLMDNLDSTTTPSTLETDLVKDYLRRLYDIVLFLPAEKVQFQSETPKEDDAAPEPDVQPLHQEAKAETEISTESIAETESASIQDSFYFDAPEVPVNDTTAESKHFLNEKLAREKVILADKIQNKKVDDLRTSIDLNEKFFFIKELFKNDSLAYDKAIRFLNGLTNFNDVQVYVAKELAVNYNWQNKTDAMERFLETVKVKFKE